MVADGTISDAGVLSQAEYIAEVYLFDSKDSKRQINVSSSLLKRVTTELDELKKKHM